MNNDYTMKIFDCGLYTHMNESARYHDYGAIL